MDAPWSFINGIKGNTPTTQAAIDKYVQLKEKNEPQTTKKFKNQNSERKTNELILKTEKQILNRKSYDYNNGMQ